MAAAMMDRSSHFRRVSDDIESEILLRLPVKSLKRFSCVCKSWYSLISSPQFKRNHFKLAQQRPPLILAVKDENRDDNSPALHFSTYNNNDDGTFTLVNKFSKSISDPYFQPSMQSCLGLVCVSDEYTDNPIHMCNPSTQEIISLPPTKPYTQCIGFGCTDSTKDYKVVNFCYEEKESKYGCEVFTLGTGHWREAKRPPFSVLLGIAPFLNGAVHCLTHVHYNDSHCIVVFDINTEEYREAIPLPTFCTPVLRRLSNLGNYLCLTFDFGALKCYLELWLLKDYTNVEWVKGYTINLSSMYSYPFSTYPTNNPVDENILLNYTTEGGVKILGYDPKDGLLTLKRDNEWSPTFYVETFYSLGLGSSGNT